MPIPGPRFRPPTLLALVALVALGLGAESTRRRYRYYREKVEYHAGQEERFREGMSTWLGLEVLSRMLDDEKSAREQHEIGVEAIALLTYHVRMARKYELAASRPWCSVPPDPPAPPDRHGYNAEEWAALRAQYSWLPADPR